MMTRRVVRALTQLGAAAVFAFAVISFLDRNYRVLPNAIHGYMPTHYPGLVITDITLVTCSTLNPFSSCELDSDVWHRVDKELYLGRAWTTTAYLYISRKHEKELTSEDMVVMDVSVGRLNPAEANQGKAVKNDQPWESRPGGLWIKRADSRRSSDASAVTDIDVLFGDDAVEARDGWTVTGTQLLLNTGRSLLSVHLTMRRGAPPKERKKPKPRIADNGRFKMMQISDLHLSNGVGECREPVPDGYEGGKCEADPRTLDFVTKMLDEEKPDLVILGGDQVNGDTAPDAPTAIFKIASLLIQRSIPYAAIFGNHDDESTMSRARQMALYETLPFSLSAAGPANIDGVGNYYIEVLARGGSDHSALTIYLLDTHSYSPNERKYPGYDWIKPNQIEWFRKTAASLKSKHAKYSHHHMDISFIHIPLTEYASPELPRLGEWKEGVTAPVYNSGFRDALVEQGVVMVSAGHDHCNDYCLLSLQNVTQPGAQLSPSPGEQPPPQVQKPALWMCYAGGVGFGGYAGYGGYVRRLRVFEVDTNEARIVTWKRVEHGKTADKVDLQIIVDGGRPVPPPPPPAPASTEQPAPPAPPAVQDVHE
ncbi:uncharacterized protein UV8b_05942 [Ustilaginoidea virens]|uniref:Calcineurin-like phosphoesterase domain-containing protein n=1 Tax=Ustilaginoidea virens TaxID=1159556 RepID=A0A8E5HUB7_USTVR|nr:uncharacterized protein UV8b_05942 [Ustilaginoidea virens]QUC21699.1 hypothetical protein UV8b_05942 [Ustilaginoidea virens]